MAREVTEAHYLHERSGLEPVLQPPVKAPCGLAWIPQREVLLAATREGQLIQVDPVLGTRTLGADLGEAAVLAAAPDRERWLVVAREGHWTLGNMAGTVLSAGKHPFLGGMDGFFAGDLVVIVGDTAEGRAMWVLRDGEVVTRARLPAGSAVAASKDGTPLLCRSLPEGLAVIPLGPDSRAPKGEATGHRLRVAGSWVLGFTASGVCVWDHFGGAPRTMRLPELSAGDVSVDGQTIGLGTRQGAVVLAHLGRTDKRVRPDLVRAFSVPVTTVAFSSRGRWLATGADGLRLWTWEA